jgi:hypothetical protein
MRKGGWKGVGNSGEGKAALEMVGVVAEPLLISVLHAFNVKLNAVASTNSGLAAC